MFYSFIGIFLGLVCGLTYCKLGNVSIDSKAYGVKFEVICLNSGILVGFGLGYVYDCFCF